MVLLNGARKVITCDPNGRQYKLLLCEAVLLFIQTAILNVLRYGTLSDVTLPILIANAVSFVRIDTVKVAYLKTEITLLVCVHEIFGPLFLMDWYQKIKESISTCKYQSLVSLIRMMIC